MLSMTIMVVILYVLAILLASITWWFMTDNPWIYSGAYGVIVSIGVLAFYGAAGFLAVGIFFYFTRDVPNHGYLIAFGNLAGGAVLNYVISSSLIHDLRKREDRLGGLHRDSEWNYR